MYDSPLRVGVLISSKNRWSPKVAERCHSRPTGWPSLVRSYPSTSSHTISGAERPRMVFGEPDQANIRNPPGYDFIFWLFTPSRPRGLAMALFTGAHSSASGLNFVSSQVRKSSWLGCIIIWLRGSAATLYACTHSASMVLPTCAPHIRVTR